MPDACYQAEWPLNITQQQLCHLAREKKEAAKVLALPKEQKESYIPDKQTKAI